MRNRNREAALFEIEVQNESDQTERTLRFVAVPRIGEGVRLLDQNGLWASFDVIDVWYQRSPYGDLWVPYMHVRKSGEAAGAFPAAAPQLDLQPIQADQAGLCAGPATPVRAKSAHCSR
jgi:hypothetical protein